MKTTEMTRLDKIAAAVCAALALAGLGARAYVHAHHGPQICESHIGAAGQAGWRAEAHGVHAPDETCHPAND